MIVSAKTEYACIAMLELAAMYDRGEPVRIREIADRHGVPSRFLVQILLQLKGAGFVISTRGATGGYQLAKSPEEITLGEVISVVDPQPSEISSSAGRETAATRVLLQTFRQVDAIQREMLSQTTFGDLAQQLQSQGEGMYYI
ncbi:MAG: RrF2 family transcriptional regulator [Planctomycetaceae bacterium]